MKSIVAFISVTLVILMTAACGGEKSCNDGKRSYAVYAEFAHDSNVVMKNGLNRRVFNTTEAQEGKDITLEKDGSITLQKGTYRITGFSLVTMQDVMAAPVYPADSQNYPGYCILYPKKYESNMGEVLKNNICIGSLGIALNSTASLVDVYYKCDETTSICLGHQVGDDLKDTIFLSVYEIDGTKSDYHVFARLAIEKIE